MQAAGIITESLIMFIIVLIILMTNFYKELLHVCGSTEMLAFNSLYGNSNNNFIR